MSLVVQPVQTTKFHQTWPLVKDFLAEALKWSNGDYTEDQAKALLAQGSWLLLVAVDEENKIHGAASVEFINFPNDRVAFITAVGGKALINEDVYKQLCAVLKGFGATKIQCAARESAARLYAKVGFEQKHIILEVSL